MSEKPVPAEIIGAIMAPDLEALEPMLIRHSDTAEALRECPPMGSGNVGICSRASTSASANCYG